MNIVISAGGRFHALQLAHHLEKRNSLTRLFTFSYTNKDQQLISPAHVSNISSCSMLDTLFLKCRLDRIIHKSSYNVFKDNLFDYLVSKKISKLGDSDVPKIRSIPRDAISSLLGKTGGKIDLFVGWAHYALHSIPAARKAGAKIIIESGSCHILEQQTLLEQEYAKYGVPFAPLHQKNIDKMLKEYELADYIMTLSDFAYQSFVKQGVPKSKLLKVTCGMDVEYFLQARTLRSIRQAQDQGERPGESSSSQLYISENNKLWILKRVQDDKIEGPCHPELDSGSTIILKSNKFRVIFVGLLNLRKGIQYLLQAWNSLNLPEQETELLLVGNLQQDLKFVLQKMPLKKNVIFYGSTNRENLRELYASSSVFVLPSVEDGFGMVMGEAMASGLPVICTTNTGGPDIITDQEHGFIIPPQNIDALAEKIAWCYNNQETCKIMGNNAQEQIKKFTWDVYGEKVYEIYKSIV